MTKVFSSTMGVLGLVLFVGVPSVAMAQNVSANPGNTNVQQYSGPGTTQGSYPVSIYGQYGQYYAGADAGNGVAGGAAGTHNNGQYNSVGASTGAPGEVCTTVPGTDIPIDCSH
jgi:hypothetical protein